MSILNLIDTFAGIGGFTAAAHPHRIRTVAFCEKDKTCHGVLRRHYPGIPIYENIETITEEFRPDYPIDILSGGFPCQDLSVAGRRAGLSGERSGLWYAMLRAIKFYQPRWVIAENVPGLLSGCGCIDCLAVSRILRIHSRIRRSKGDKPCDLCVASKKLIESHSGRNFTEVVQGLVKLGYGVSWRVFDAQYAGLAQRRQRVFIVASLGTGSCAEILFERESSAWNPPPRREAGERASNAITRGAGKSSGPRNGNGTPLHLVTGTLTPGAHPGGLNGRDGETGNGLIIEEIAATLTNNYSKNGGLQAGKASVPSNLVAFGGNNQSGPVDVATACNAHGGTGRIDFQTETFICQDVAGTLAASGAGTERPAGQENEPDFLIAHTLRANGCDASEDGTGRGTPLVVALQDISRRTGAITNDQQHGTGLANADDPMYTLQASTQHGVLIASDTAPPSRSIKPVSSEVGDSCGQDALIAFSSKDSGMDAQTDISPTLRSMNYDRSHINGGGQVAIAFAVQEDNQNGVLMSDTAGTLRSDAPGHQPCGTLAFTERSRTDGHTFECQEEMAYALTDASKGGNPHSGKVANNCGVRRLTPRECERLQGYQDDYTRYDETETDLSDSSRYRMLGNSIAVPCVDWIMERIAALEETEKD